MEERRAIGRLKEGDIGGLEALVRLHHTRAVRAVDMIVHDTGLAQEIVQAAFVRVYERIGRFDAERSFGPYFMKIVVNDAIKAASRCERTFSFYQGDTEDLRFVLRTPVRDRTSRRKRRRHNAGYGVRWSSCLRPNERWWCNATTWG